MNNNQRLFFTLITLTFLLTTTGCSQKKNNKSLNIKPNIVVIYLDDLGYGDMGVYGATEVETPHMDKLADEGIRFTDGHSSSATCTPSRYALLTGEYPWRNKNAKILPGEAPLLIRTDQMTIAKMLSQNGYSTGIVGKWHLGLGLGDINWNETIAPGPNEVGFDYSFIMAATQDRVPTVFIKDGDVVGLDPNDPIEVSYSKNFEGEPTGIDNPELLRMKWYQGHNNSIVNGIPRIGFMKGGEKAKWVDEDIADVFLEKAQQYVRNHKNEPFFLLYTMQQPHVPRTPHSRFVGKTNLGPRGDVIAEADWCIGEFMKTLDQENLLENTLVILTSDNGPVVNDGYYDESEEKLGDHKPAGPLRGGKYSLFEAGTRIPFISYWKGHIKPGVSDALVSQVDLLSSFSTLVGSAEKTPDSEDLMNVLLGKTNQGRKSFIMEASSRTALRKENWIMIPPYPGPPIIKFTDIESGKNPKYQLYDISNDISQEENQAEQNPEKLKKMISLYEEIIAK